MIKDYVNKERANTSGSSIASRKVNVRLGFVAGLGILAVTIAILFNNNQTVYEKLQVKVQESEIADVSAEIASPIVFAYEEMLAEAEVHPGQVEEYVSTPKDPNKKYNKLLRVASFNSEALSNKLAKQLIAKNLPGVRVAMSNDGKWHYVTIGPFESRSKLNKAQDILAQMSYVPVIVSK